MLGITIVEGLMEILGSVHAAGYVHNDLKADQVAVDMGVSGVDITLLDLGKMTKIGGRPYKDFRKSGKKRLRENSSHLAPEAIEGQEVTPSSDIFSLGTLIEDVGSPAFYKEVSGIVALAAEEDPRDRPNIQAIREIF